MDRIVTGDGEPRTPERAEMLARVDPTLDRPVILFQDVMEILYAADKKGLPEAKLGWFFFSEVQGGKGKANDIFGSVYGWLVSKDAPKEALDFMKVCLGKETHTKLAAEGLSIPMVKGTAEAIQNPFYKALAVEVDHSGWICVAMDQLLGRETGRIFNDEAAAVAAGAHSPEEATQVIEHSWSKSRI